VSPPPPPPPPPPFRSPPPPHAVSASARAAPPTSAALLRRRMVVILTDASYVGACSDATRREHRQCKRLRSLVRNSRCVDFDNDPITTPPQVSPHFLPHPGLTARAAAARSHRVRSVTTRRGPPHELDREHDVAVHGRAGDHLQHQPGGRATEGDGVLRHRRQPDEVAELV